MILDTGATRTFLSRGLANRAGITSSNQLGSVVVTANGTTWEAGGRADIISVGAAKLKNVAVFVENPGSRSFEDGIEGLLGLSFLGSFRVQIGRGTLTLKPI